MRLNGLDACDHGHEDGKDRKSQPDGRPPPGDVERAQTSDTQEHDGDRQQCQPKPFGMIEANVHRLSLASAAAWVCLDSNPGPLNTPRPEARQKTAIDQAHRS